MQTEKIIIKANITAILSKNNFLVLFINIEAKIINPGNLPLHGVKLLVRIAINFSRSELIVLHETTPAALQPNPMHILKTYFP